MSTTRTTTVSRTVLGVSPTITPADALSLATDSADALNVAAVAAHYVIGVQKSLSIRDYAAQSATLSKSAVGRLVHVGAAIVAIGTVCTPADARNVARTLNVLPVADVTKATDGKSGKALAKAYGTLAGQATKRIGERPARAPKSANPGTSKSPKVARPQDVVATICDGISLLVDPRFTDEQVQRVREHLDRTLAARASNVSARTGVSKSA